MKTKIFYVLFFILMLMGILFVGQAFETTTTPVHYQFGFNRFGVATSTPSTEIVANGFGVYAGICWLLALASLYYGQLLAR